MIAKRTETSIESASMRYAKKKNWVSRKMNGMGFRSWPDRLMLPPPKHKSWKISFWIEFKRPGKKPTIGQAKLHKKLRQRGEQVFVVDSVDKFKALIK